MSTRPAIVIEERVTVPASAFDHAGYRAWVTSDEYPERIRTTFVRGEVLIEMSPESLEKHNKVKAPRRPRSSASHKRTIWVKSIPTVRS